MSLRVITKREVERNERVVVIVLMLVGEHVYMGALEGVGDLKFKSNGRKKRDGKEVVGSTRGGV